MDLKNIIEVREKQQEKTNKITYKEITEIFYFVFGFLVTALLFAVDFLTWDNWAQLLLIYLCFTYSIASGIKFIITKALKFINNGGLNYANNSRLHKGIKNAQSVEKSGRNRINI